MIDKIEQYGSSIFQHGKVNNRIYLMKVGRQDCKDILTYFDKLAKKEGYSKIVAKIPADLSAGFIDNGYKQEGLVEGFFYGDTDCLFLCKYFDDDRPIISDKTDQQIKEILEICKKKMGSSGKPLSKEYEIKHLDENHVDNMAQIYGEVFQTYPFPINNADYLRKTMADNVDYFGVYKGNELVGLSSSEMDLTLKNTEMTDFAVSKAYQQAGFSYPLLIKMEEKAADKGMITSYTIARSINPAINIIFAKAGYKFGGTLINNTNIFKGIESMNLWYKRLR